MEENFIVAINLKTYKFGEDVLKLAIAIQKVSQKIILGVSPTDISFISRATNLKVYSQHVDYFEPGRNTGFIIPESVKSMGAVGTFLNHSEHKIKFFELKKTIERCKKVGLKTFVFSGSIFEAKKIEKLKPDYLVYEPPELVAGKISVSTGKPDIIAKICKEIKMPIIVGAGIKDYSDVKKSIELGAKGIAVSSAITLSKNPERELMKILGIRKKE